jgi:putative ABC transport system substrate-binding protein
MRRREFITLLGGSAAAWPLAASAQEAGRMYRIGFMAPLPRASPAIKAFFDELRLNGFIEGQNVAVVGTFNVSVEDIAGAAPRLVAEAPDVVVCGPELYARGLQALSPTIPIVSMSEDLVGEGLVASLAKPGGNITGISLLSPELDDKRQDILIEAVPGIRKIAALADSSITSQRHLSEQQEAARARNVELSMFTYAKAGEIAAAIEAAKSSGAQAINFLASPQQVLSRSVIFERVSTLRLPAIFQWPDLADEGGLIAYGPRYTQMYRQRARQIVKILRGAKAADIPVEQPASFELVINLQAAKAIGLEIPAGLVLRADTVIE